MPSSIIGSLTPTMYTVARAKKILLRVQPAKRPLDRPDDDESRVREEEEEEEEEQDEDDDEGAVTTRFPLESQRSWWWEPPPSPGRIADWCFRGMAAWDSCFITGMHACPVHDACAL
eukprot:3984982-Prymnesium_polylepis.1